MKKFFLFLKIIVLPLSISAQTTYTLKQCIDLAWQNNLQIKQSALFLETTETNFNQSKNNRLPTVNGQYNFGINNGRSIDPFTNARIGQQLSSSNVGIGGGITVYNGGRLQNLIKQSGHTLQAAKLDLEQEKNALTLNIILAFLQVLNNEDLLKLSVTQANVTKKQVERLEILNNTGAIQPSLLYDMKGQYASDELNITNGENALNVSKLTLLQLMNVPFDKDIKLERGAFESTPSTVLAAYETSVQQIYEEAIKNFALIKAAEMRQKSAKMAIKVAESNFYPIVSLQGQLGTNYSSLAQSQIETGSTDIPTSQFVELNGNKLPVISKQATYKSDKIGYINQLGNNVNSFVGVNVQIPIFNAFQAKTLVNLAKIQEKASVNQSDILKLQLKQAIEQAHLNMTATYNRYTITLRQVQAFQQSFNVAEKRFSGGVIHAVDYLIVKNNLDRAQANLINAQYDYLLRVKVLDFYRGK